MIFDKTFQFKHAPRGVLLSRDYYEEVLDLMNDPLLQEMADEAATYDPGVLEDFDQHTLTMAVNAEYKRRGGVLFRTIGGPTWALKELVTFKQEHPDG